MPKRGGTGEREPVKKGEGKKTFDKKKWREKKYNKKYKIEQWEERRRKAVLRQYYKQLSDDGQLPAGTSQAPSLPKKKLSGYAAAKEEMRRLKEEKERAVEERERRMKEKKEKLEEYRRQKSDKYRILSRHNSKGQPVMKGRLQMLYSQIKESLL